MNKKLNYRIIKSVRFIVIAVINNVAKFDHIIGAKHKKVAP